MVLTEDAVPGGEKNASAMGNRERGAVQGGRKGQRCWLSGGFSFATHFLAV